MITKRNIGDLIYHKPKYLLEITNRVFCLKRGDIRYQYKALNIASKKWTDNFHMYHEDLTEDIKNKEYVLLNNTKLARLYLLEEITNG